MPVNLFYLVVYMPRTWQTGGSHSAQHMISLDSFQLPTPKTPMCMNCTSGPCSLQGHTSAIKSMGNRIKARLIPPPI